MRTSRARSGPRQRPVGDRRDSSGGLYRGAGGVLVVFVSDVGGSLGRSGFALDMYSDFRRSEKAFFAFGAAAGEIVEKGAVGAGSLCLVDVRHRAFLGKNTELRKKLPPCWAEKANFSNTVLRLFWFPTSSITYP